MFFALAKLKALRDDRECLPFTKQLGNFGSTEDGKAVLACPNSLERWSTGISKRKVVFHLFFLAVSGSAPIVKLVPDFHVNQSELHKWYMVVSKGFPIREVLICTNRRPTGFPL